MWGLPLMPEQASTFAGPVDAIYFTIWTLTAIFTVLVCALVIFFVVKYRRGTRADRTHPPHEHLPIELTWTIIPLILGLGVFFWNARLYAEMYSTPPANAMEIFVIGKQWMWHAQHLNGVRENNELHVPAGQPIKLTLTSQDVIHSFFVPAFRIKRDVVPGRFNQVWFTPTKVGKYHLFCAEYCGTEHSRMTGSVYVMEPTEFQRWLAGGGEPLPATRLTMAQQGEKLYKQLACDSCHGATNTRRGPSLAGLYGKMVQLSDGQIVKADEAYIRQEILTPNERLTAGYEPIMPEYKGELSEEKILQLITYIRSLPAPGKPAPASPPTPATPASGAAGAQAKPTENRETNDSTGTTSPSTPTTGNQP